MISGHLEGTKSQNFPGRCPWTHWGLYSTPKFFFLKPILMYAKCSTDFQDPAPGNWDYTQSPIGYILNELCQLVPSAFVLGKSQESSIIEGPSQKILGTCRLGLDNGRVSKGCLNHHTELKIVPPMAIRISATSLK